MREIKTNIKKPALITKRREQIIQAAMVLFRKKGYQRTTMREICEKSKVNRGSFYDYFGSKEDILVFIYKQMMYLNGNFEISLQDENISDWDDLEPYIRSNLSVAWKKNKHRIQILYREIGSLGQKTMMDIFKIESEYVRLVAENLRKGLGVPAVTQELEILANIIIYIDSFFPIRSWNMHHLDQERILNFVIEMIMMKLKNLKGLLKEERETMAL